MDRYNEMMKGKKTIAIIFTLALIVGIGLIVATVVADMDILFWPGIALTIVGVYVSSILWAVIQNDRIFDEQIIKAVTVNNITSFNALNAHFKINVDKLIHRIEYLAEKGCFTGYVFDRTYGLKKPGEKIEKSDSKNNETQSSKRENLTQCSSCGASMYNENGECPYCGAKK